MTARGFLRGHPIYWDGEQYRYEDDDQPTVDTWQSRPCGYCGRFSTPEGHDPCLGTLPGVANACCGHGVREEAYIQFTNGTVVRGFDVIERSERNARSPLGGDRSWEDTIPVSAEEFDFER